jgi:hypothetical protein
MMTIESSITMLLGQASGQRGKGNLANHSRTANKYQVQIDRPAFTMAIAMKFNVLQKRSSYPF